ncbi:MAG: flagellin FliC [Magnetococcales bacterium]|nr:flagellin FliC [Magnetococcales bacterium]
MALTINGSIASINAQRQLAKHTNGLTQTFQRLSSGLRVNSAKDDAAGLAIANRMTAQIRGLNAAARNANDGISMAQVAEGALEETSNALQRIRELAVQASNDTYSSTDRSSLNTEVTQMLAEVQRIALNTNFNGNALFGGKASVANSFGTAFSGTFQIGPEAGQTFKVTILRADISALGLSVTGGGAFGVSTAALAMSAIERVDSALDAVSDIRAGLGAVQSRFESIISNLSSVSENTDAARSRIQDADIAQESANLTRLSILQQAGVAVLSQANQQPTIALALLGG